MEAEGNDYIDYVHVFSSDDRADPAPAPVAAPAPSLSALEPSTSVPETPTPPVQSPAAVSAPMSSTPEMDLSPSDDEADLLDYGDSPTCMELDVNMVCTLPAEFQIEEEKIAQLCLGPRNAIFEKSEKSI